METSGSSFLRKAAPDWNLAGDKHLLGLLEQTHQNIIIKCQEVSSRLDEMVTTLDSANIDLQNVNNKFMALSNRQFVESRVYDDDIDIVEENTGKKEPPKIVEPENETLKLKHSLQRLQEYHDSVRIVDSESSDEEDEGQLVLKLKNVYSARPLPYIIGSNAWRTKWHVGLVAEDSDSETDSSYKRGASPREQYSESEPSEPDVSDNTAAEHTAQRTISSGSDICSEASPQVARPADIAAEIAKRLGGHPAKLPEPDLTPPEPTARKLYSVEKPVASTIFFDEPPPLDQTEQDDYSDEDDIFAELHKKPFSYSNKDQNANIAKNVVNDLFGDDDMYYYENSVQNPTEPYKSSNEKPSTSNYDFEPPPIIQKPPEPNPRVQQAESKKPVGGISLFGTNQGTESIGEAILKRNRRKSSTDEESEDKKQIINSDKTKGNLHENQGNSESDVIKNLFIRPKSAKNDTMRTKKGHEKKENLGKKVDLFSDNIFDDIDDIFSSSVVTKPKESSKKSIFDDDDLFADVAVKSETSHSDKKVKSVFDSDDELFKDDVVKNIETHKVITDTNKYIEQNIQHKKIAAKSIFDDSDDELFSTANNLKSEPHQLPAKEFNVTDPQYKSDETTEDGSHKNEQVLQKSNILFSNIDDDIFSNVEINNANDEEKQNSKIKENSSVIKNNDTDKIINEKRFQSDILFDDENDDGIFLGKNDYKSTKVTKDATKIKLVENNDFNVNENNIVKENKLNQNEVKDIPNNATDLSGDNRHIYEPQKRERFYSPPIFEDDENADFPIDKTKINNRKDQIQQTPFFVKTSTEGETNEQSTKENNETTSSDYVFENRNDIVSEQKTESDDNLEESVDWESSTLQNDYESKSHIQEYKENTLGNLETIDNNPKSLNVPPSRQDIFDDLFNDLPPEFEKPTEPKKSKNVNALFDDDSDDEALFFKKNDAISDEKPELDYGDERFRIFSDEPPDIDFDFSQKPRNVASDIENHNLFYDETSKLESKVCAHNQTLKHQINESQLESSKSQTHSQQSADSQNFSIRDKIFDNPENDSTHTSFTQTISEITKSVKNTEIDLNKEIVSSPEIDNRKVIGKLKPTNLNINVNTLLPGAVKKFKTTDEIDNQKLSTQSNEELNKNAETTASKIIKSVSFDNAESGILDNKLSKERARIKIKRRPSSRRARLEAVRKSGIDFGEDSPDTSSFEESLDSKSQSTKNHTLFSNKPEDPSNVTEDLQKDKLFTISSEVNESVLASVIDNIQKVGDSENRTNNGSRRLSISEELISGESSEIGDSIIGKEIKENIQKTLELDSTPVDSCGVSILKSTLNEDKDTLTGISNRNMNEEQEKAKFITDDKTEFSQNTSSLTEKKMPNISKTTEIKDTINKNVKSKVVYILNDEDIFNTGGANRTKKIEDEITKKPLTFGDDDDELFKSPPKISTLGNTYTDASQKIISNQAPMKSKSSQEPIKTKSIFDDLSDGEDLFKSDSSRKKVQRDEKKEVDRNVLKSKKELRNVSLFGDESDDDLFTPKPSRNTEAQKMFTPRESSKISSDPVTDDPLSTLTDDS